MKDTLAEILVEAYSTVNYNTATGNPDKLKYDKIYLQSSLTG